jgi:murein DD-endopeptidase MepM/ murein hydrolase activator NlpD
MVDHALQWASEPGSCDLENNYSWNRQIWSPVEGRVRGVVRSRPDGSPCVNGEGDPNSVYLDLGGEVGLWLAHFRQGSIVLDEGDPVGPGEYLGRVGNSGTSSGPHLHLGLYDTGDGSTTLPLALRDVRVGLNPGPDDPWARELAVWEPREGFFVNPLRSIRR